MIWTYPLSAPVEIDGRSLTTLADARALVLSVPGFRGKAHWEVVSRSLLLAASTGTGADLARATADLVAALDAERRPEDLPPAAPATPAGAKRRRRIEDWVETAKSLRKPP